MLSYEDCLALCELTEDEIEAIAEHEHLPQMAALELGSYLIHSPDGVPHIKRIILDDIQHAEHSGNSKHVLHLKLVLKHFIDTHPQNPAKQTAGRP